MVHSYSNLTKPPISKEYGAWASLAVAFIIGVGVAGRITLESSILFLGALSFFLAHTPFLTIIKNRQVTRHTIWFFLYVLTGTISFSVLLLKYKLTNLSIFIILSLIIFSYNTYITYKKGSRAKGAGFSGVLGVSLLSSFAYYVAGGALDNVISTLWILVFLYLAAGIFYVKARLGVFKWQTCICFYIIAMIITGILSGLRLSPYLSIIAYLPAVVKCLRLAHKSASFSEIKMLGRRELYYSIIFAIILVIAHHL